jgi:hypothetical protein
MAADGVCWVCGLALTQDGGPANAEYRRTWAGVCRLGTISTAVDLLVVPPGSAEADALGAMDLAAQAVNLIRVPDILATLTSPAQPTGTALELSVWESDGGRLASPTDAT